MMYMILTIFDSFMMSIEVPLSNLFFWPFTSWRLETRVVSVICFFFDQVQKRRFVFSHTDELMSKPFLYRIICL